MKVFYSFSSIDWGRVSIVVSSATAFWLGLVSIIPEKYHHYGTVILGALSSAILILIRGGRPSVPEAVRDDLIQKIQDSTITESSTLTGNAVSDVQISTSSPPSVEP